MAKIKYSVKVTKATKSGAAEAYLLEDGSQIAKVTRPANQQLGSTRYCAGIGFRWYSERARARFDDFCDSNGASEAVSALGFPSPF